MSVSVPASRILFAPGAKDQRPWQIVNDDVMGGDSTSRFWVSDRAAAFEGALSLANGGGFASFRWLLAPSLLAGLDTFVIQLRGDGRRYRFTLRTELQPSSPTYQTILATQSGVWEELRAPISQFVATFRGRPLPLEPPPDPARIVSMGFLISDQQEGPFHLEIGRIEAVRGSGTPLQAGEGFV